jgi:formate hydrogenlyase subunit 6/NADH:ubiquinone oxidoreductase subunit I
MNVPAAENRAGLDIAKCGAVREYFANIKRAVFSIFEGLTVTSSWLFRRPATIQYPDRIEKPIQEMLPDNYRGLLEVDLARCSGCLLCMKNCPIGVIQVKVEKNAETGVREITQFDIDVGRCMYCGLCSEQCKFDALRHTTDFEAVASSPDNLVLHYVKTPTPVSKLKAGEGAARRPQGSILREVVAPCYGRVRWHGMPPGEKTEPSPEDGTEPEKQPPAASTPSAKGTA